MKIVTVRMKDKNLDCPFTKRDFLRTKGLAKSIKAKGNLNHLFLIHPENLDGLTELLNSLDGKSYWFAILISTDTNMFSSINLKKNIWTISYPITSPANIEIQNKFNTFYEEVVKINSVKNTQVIKNLIIKHLDSSFNLTPKMERDISLIKMWKSMGYSQDWKNIKDFKNYSEEQFKEIEYYLGKTS